LIDDMLAEHVQEQLSKSLFLYTM